MINYVGRIRQGNCRRILLSLEAELRARLDRRPSLNQLILEGLDSLDDGSIRETRAKAILFYLLPRISADHMWGYSSLHP